MKIPRNVLMSKDEYIGCVCDKAFYDWLLVHHSISKEQFETFDFESKDKYICECYLKK